MIPWLWAYVFGRPFLARLTTRTSPGSLLLLSISQGLSLLPSNGESVQHLAKAYKLKGLNCLVNPLPKPTLRALRLMLIILNYKWDTVNNLGELPFTHLHHAIPLPQLFKFFLQLLFHTIEEVSIEQHSRQLIPHWRVQVGRPILLSRLSSNVSRLL